MESFKSNTITKMENLNGNVKSGLIISSYFIGLILLLVGIIHYVEKSDFDKNAKAQPLTDRNSKWTMFMLIIGILFIVLSILLKYILKVKL